MSPFLPLRCCCPAPRSLCLLPSRRLPGARVVTDASLVDDVNNDGELSSLLAVVQHDNASDLHIGMSLHLQTTNTHRDTAEAEAEASARAGRERESNGICRAGAALS